MKNPAKRVMFGWLMVDLWRLVVIKMASAMVQNEISSDFTDWNINIISDFTHETVGSAVKSGTRLDSSTTKLGGMNQQQLRGIYNKHMEYLPAIIPRIITILTTNNTGTNQQSGEIKHQTLGLYQLVMDMFGFKQGFIYLDPSKTEMLASKQMGYMGIWIYIYI